MLYRKIMTVLSRPKWNTEIRSVGAIQNFWMLKLVVNRQSSPHPRQETRRWRAGTDPHTLKLCSMWWQIEKAFGFKGDKFKAFWKAVTFDPKNMGPYLSTVNRHHKFWISTINIVEYIRKTKINKRATILSTHTHHKSQQGEETYFFPKRPGGLWGPHSPLFNSHTMRSTQPPVQ